MITNDFLEYLSKDGGCFHRSLPEIATELITLREQNAKMKQQLDEWAPLMAVHGFIPWEKAPEGGKE